MTSLIIALIATGVISAIAFPGVRQALRIRVNAAVSNSTTPIERLRDEHEQLLAKLPAQQTSVANTQAGAVQAHKDLEQAQSRLAKLEGQYQTAQKLKGVSQEALDKLVDQIAEQEETVEQYAAISEESAGLAKEALEALNRTTTQLKQFEREVELAGRKAELTAARKQANEVADQLGGINSSLSKAKLAARQVDLELEAARAKSKLTGGSPADQELAQIEAAERRQRTLERLQAKSAPQDSSSAG